MTRALISVGSNLVDPMLQVLKAHERISTEFDDVVISQLYTTEPVGPVDQPPFINAAILLSTEISSEALLARLQELEIESGRLRDDEISKGPRILDLDLILFGSEIVQSKKLQLPHPSFRKRKFVLIPSNEIAGQMVDPVTGLSIQALLDACDDPSWVKVFNTERALA